MAADLGTAYIKIAPNMTGVQGKVLSGFRGLGTQAEAQMANELKGGKAFTAGMAALWGTATAVANKAINSFMGSLDAGIKRFDTLNNYPKVMKSLGYSTDEAKKSISRMSDAASGLPTSLNDLADTTKLLAPLSSNLDEATSLAIGLNDAFLAAGASSFDTSRGMQQLSQMLAKGTVDMQSWRSVQETMPSSLSQIAKMLGITTGNTNDLYDAMKSGKISMDDFRKAVITMDTQGGAGFASFHQQALDATGGIATGMANMGNAWARVWQKILDAIGSDVINQYFASATKRINEFGSVLVAGVGFVKKYFDQIKVGASVVAGLGAAFAAAAIADKIAAVSSAISKAGSLIKWLQSSSGAMSQFSQAIGLIKANPIIAAIAGIVTALTLFFTQTETGQKLFAQLAQTVQSVFGGLASAIGPTLTSLGQTIGTVFSNIGTAVGPALSSLGSTLSNVFSSLGPTLSNLASNLGGALSQALQAIAPIIGIVADGFGKLVAAAGPALSNALAALGPIFKAIGDALIQIFPSLVPLGQAFQQLGQALGNAFTTLAPTFKDLFNTLGQLLQALAGLVPALLGPLGQLAVTLGQTLAGAVKQLAPVFGDLVSALGGIFVKILPTIASLISTVAKAFVQLLPVVLAIVPMIASLAATLVTQLLPPIIQLISTILPPILQLLTALVPIFTTIITAILPPIISVINALLPLLVQIVAAILPPLIAIINNVLIPAITAIVNIVTTVINAVVPAIQAAIQTITSVIQFFVDLFSGNFTKLGQDISNIWSNLWNFVGSVIGGAWNIIKGIASGIWNTIVNIFKGLWGGISGFLGGFVNNVKNFFGGLPGKIWDAIKGIGDVGKNLIQGLWNGINNMAGWIKDKISGFGKGVLDSLKKFFGIHSPSTVMRDEVGKYLSLGLAEGITANAGAVNDAMNDLSNQALGQFNNISSGLQANLSATGIYGGVNPNILTPTVIVNQNIDQVGDQVDVTELGYKMGFQASQGLSQAVGGA